MTYYIYHIPTIKIGVSTKPERRVRRQGFYDYEILEQHECVYKVSDREQELQRHYGYKVDDSPYWKTLLSPTKDGRSKGGKIGGKIVGKINGKINGKLPSYSLRKLDYEKAQYIRAQYARRFDVFGNKISILRLSKIFEVSYFTIHAILKNKTYTTP